MLKKPQKACGENGRSKIWEERGNFEPEPNLRCCRLGRLRRTGAVVAVAEGGGTEGKEGGRTPAPAESKAPPLPRPIPPLGKHLNISRLIKSIFSSESDEISFHSIAAFHRNFYSKFDLYALAPWTYYVMTIYLGTY